MPQNLCPTILADYQHQATKVSGAAKMALIAPLYLSMIAGTGGVYTPKNLPRAFAAHQNQIFDIRGLHTKRNQLLSISQHLISIREMFGLKMSELSQIFGVTRPTAYAWINGTEPKPDVKAKICRLSKHVEGLRSAGIERVAMLARLPIANDRSLVDLLKSGSDVQDAMASIRQAAMQTMQRASVKREFGPSSKKRRVSVDAISTPIVTGDQS